jgi:hypothetical protein
LTEHYHKLQLYVHQVQEISQTLGELLHKTHQVGHSHNILIQKNLKTLVFIN